MPSKINYQIKTKAFKPDKKMLGNVIRQTFKRYNIDNIQLDILICDDDFITEQNSLHLNHNYATDVISFDLSDDFEDKKVYTIIVNAQMAQRQAGKRAHTEQAELALYICHGILHNLGYDDSNNADAKKMHKEEDEILEYAGIGKIYNG